MSAAADQAVELLLRFARAAAFDTIVTMLAITYGLIASTIVLPDQPAMSGGREGAPRRRER